jgi:DNA (cytosine-5)-methyltransferase 1
MSEWLGDRLAKPGTATAKEVPLEAGAAWPIAAHGRAGKAWQVDISMRPHSRTYGLRQFLLDPLKPLSARATAGFLERARRGKLRFADGFLDALDHHLGNERAA